MFNIAVNKEETLFEKMAKRIKKNEMYMKKRMKELQDHQELKHTKVD